MVNVIQVSQLGAIAQLMLKMMQNGIAKRELGSKPTTNFGDST